MENCPFCFPQATQTFSHFIFKNDHVYAAFDNFPATKGHLLIIPCQHVEHWFVTPPRIQQAILEAVNTLQAYLLKEYAPAGFNFGLNCGRAAGQTIFHTHLHLIPRYVGDVSDPEGGIRNLFKNRSLA